MEIYEKFKKLAEKQKLTATEKKEIEEVAQTYGLTINKTCPDCYADAAMQIALANKPKPKSTGAYVLRDDIDVTVHSYRHGTFRVCPALCNDETAKQWIAAGIPLRYFAKYPKDAGNGAD